MKKIIFLLTFFILFAGFAAASYTDAKLIQEHTGEITNLYYETYTDSFGDQGGRNPNVVLRLYSDNPNTDFNSNFVAAVVYSDLEHNNFVILQNIVHIVGFDDDGINYEVTGNYIDTDLDFSTSQANYPGFIYAVVSKDDGIIESSDTFIKINPEDSWLVGADGGNPCKSIGSQWVIENDCNVESDADQTYDSYDLKVDISGNSILITDIVPYWLSELDYAVEIDRNREFIVEIIDSDTGNSLDSVIASLNEDVLLDPQSANNVGIYINSIKEAEYSLSNPSTTASESSISSTSSNVYSNLKLEFTFPGIEEINLATIYLNNHLDSSFLEIVEVDKDILGILKGYYSVDTDIDAKNIDSAFLRFTLKRKWIRDNLLGVNEVMFFLIKGKETVKIVPEILSEDPEVVDYIVKLDELGDFMIGNLEKSVVKTKSEVKDLSSEPVVQQPVIVEESEDDSQQKTIAITLYVLLALVIAVILYFVLKKRKKHRRRRR